MIGKGEFGGEILFVNVLKLYERVSVILEVHAGEYRGLQVAVKTLLKEKQNAQSIANFTREAAVMS